MAKPWVSLTAEAVAALPGQLGVFQLADGAAGAETITHIGYAGGREPFGLRSALAAVLERSDEAAGNRDSDGADTTPSKWFRYELTHAYLTRWEELLMVHQAMHGQLPPGNHDHPHAVGRLRLG